MIETSWPQQALRWRLQIYDEAICGLARAKASPAALAVFVAVFRQRLQLAAVRLDIINRPALAKATGYSEKQVTRALAWLHEQGMLCIGRDGSGRILRIWVPFAFIHKVTHSLRPVKRTGTSMSRSAPPAYKEPPNSYNRNSLIGTALSAQGHQKRPTATAPRTGRRLVPASGAIWGALQGFRDHGPPWPQ